MFNHAYFPSWNFILETQQESGAPSSFDDSDQNEVPPQQREGQAEQNDAGDSQHVQNDAESGHPHLTERQKKLLELRLKMVMQFPTTMISIS